MERTGNNDIETPEGTQPIMVDNGPMRAEDRSRIRKFVVAIPRILTIIFIIILLVWITEAEGGIGSSESNVFGVHALLMGLFVTVFIQEGLLSFSAPLISPKSRNRTHLRFFHVSYHILGLTCAIVGLVAIVAYKNMSAQPLVFPYYYLFSPHSWIGVACMTLWGIQFVGGFFSQAIKAKLTVEQRKVFLKWHRFLGRAVYVIGLATCALGLQDMQSSDLAMSTPMNAPMPASGMQGYLPYSDLAQYACICTLLLLLLGTSTFVTFVNE